MRHFASKALLFRVHEDGRVEKQDRLDPEREWLPAMLTLADLVEDYEECKCTMRGKLLGDGCHICNPELAAQFANDADDLDAGMCEQCNCPVVHGLCECAPAPTTDKDRLDWLIGHGVMDFYRNLPVDKQEARDRIDAAMKEVKP